LLVILAVSPFAPRPLKAKRDPAPCPQRGEKRESSGDTGRKRGSEVCGAFPATSPRANKRENSHQRSRMPAGSIGVNSPGGGWRSRRRFPAGGRPGQRVALDRVLDAVHDFVIGVLKRNKLKDRPNCSVGARVREREDEWTGLMRSAISGDNAAYQRLLKAVTPVLRAAARRGLARAGQPVDQSEDIVQDILLAVHLKRHTWDAGAPFAPWLFAIARNKLIDALRRRGRRIFVNIDDFAETIPSEPAAETVPATEVAAQLQSLPVRQREVLQSIAVDSASIKDTAAKFAMSEGAVRVALHRGLASLTAKLREQ
jgi:RNA polymerase sigma-70 factor (ECF subfamily)